MPKPLPDPPPAGALRRMLRHWLPITDGPKRIPVAGDVRHVAAAQLGVGPTAPRIVEFWAEGTIEADGPERTFQVFGTGHPLPADATWRGTTDRTADGLVWHLYELATTP